MDVKRTSMMLLPTVIPGRHICKSSESFLRLNEAKLTIYLSKCEFARAQVTFLGHVVGQGKVQPVNAKIAAIFEFPQQENKKQLMRFLCMAGYYRKFCPNFSAVTEPLTRLLNKREKFVWCDTCQKALQELRALLNSAPVLAAPDFNAPFKLAVDASDVAAGAVLLQEDKHGVDHPVCYFSKKFSKSQRNYSTIERECLALVLALQHFELYITSSSLLIKIFSDHNPLVFLHKSKDKNQLLLRWSLMLQEYDLDITHIKGKDNVIADCLSIMFVEKHNLEIHCYADNNQLYLSFCPNNIANQEATLARVERCIEDIHEWMLNDKLKFNDDKSEFIIIGTSQKLAKVSINTLRIRAATITPVSSARNLGSRFDSKLTMPIHLLKTCNSAFYYLYNLRHIRKYLSKGNTKTLVHAFISSRIDYYNSLLWSARVSTQQATTCAAHEC